MATCSLEELREMIGDRPRHDLPLAEQNILYDRLHQTSGKLKLPVIVPTLRVTVTDKKTNQVVYDSGERPSYSTTRNWWNWMTSRWNKFTGSATTWGDGYLSIKKQTGETKYMSNSFTYYNRDGKMYGYGAGNGSVSNGIIIGRSSQAEAFSDYIIVSMVGAGSGSGQLAYGSCTPSNEFTDATIPIRKAKYDRAFSNLSASAVHVREAALYARYTNNVKIRYTGICMIRDKFSTVVSVGVSQVLRLSYYFQMNYPSGV